ncbi:hypothetical protein GUITHDRAFT_148120 [Guillardia theta CCMP2712]|uniref:Uncharacterized protein n=1 Tax=Guillardia theta (strain CCMP2712) TaxID=905079 RepID=L1IBG5_GUITC|nr:hypothetical protein GUITHDRAFT_148120 [Guillardia theta CCMP2712]EKX33180.1 hypothetical protein GUITHDRAFT_148120 [Guillardia theta CCMP2712]|eukprot:XP_005820160.1 hypothetical protein GUITHDRAFT_148120 [Guillardia theta CCMP2712]
MPRASKYQDTIEEDREYDDDYRAGTPETVDENMDAQHKQTTNRTIRDLSTFEMTVNHSKILILISKYAQCALTAEDHETWFRQLPLQVMIYEGISAGVLDYDYSPTSVFVSFDGSSRRIYMNISQEGSFHPITAYQLSLKGLQFLKTLPNSLFEEVNEFVYAPNAPHYETELLECSFNGEVFVLKTRSGFQRDSSITVLVLRLQRIHPSVSENKVGKAMTDNSHRANECAAGYDNIRDELTETIHLSYVTVIVGEWVPYGANNIVALNERLGILERCQGGLYTSFQDKNPSGTNFKVPPGLTSVEIIDYNMTRFANFESEISFPEDSGILQIENFGIHVNVDGTVCCGVRIEAVKDRRADDVSLDLLSRVLVDIQMDSSRILHDLLAGYQRGLLDMLFMGDAANRNKYSCVLAESIQPKMPAKDYISRGEAKNEIRQILGEIYTAEDIGNDDVIILGRDGLILAGPNCLRLEPLVIYYVSLLCRETFIRNFFIRTFILTEQGLTGKESKDGEQLRLDTQSKEGGVNLSQGHEAAHVIKASVYDLGKLIAGASNQLENLQQVSDVINTKQLERLYFEVENNTQMLVDSGAAFERSGAALSVMNVVLAGSFAFALLDRLCTTWVNASPPVWFTIYVIQPFVNPPGVFFCANLVWVSVFCYALIRYMRYITFKASGVLNLRVTVNKKIKSMVQLELYLKGKKWLGAPPLVEITIDTLFHFVLVLDFSVDKKRSNATEVAFGENGDDIELQQEQARARQLQLQKDRFKIMLGLAGSHRRRQRKR